ncbi:hypothetical protein [Salaquimonas pukyongi]|uniref:hypothetical protein n=1 Tax=Salaquimonas pukyongi TaxID=2712698 RepID=UPI00096B9090|nr:hypothetical protein [Salaquimonas pukyongi]
MKKLSTVVFCILLACAGIITPAFSGKAFAFFDRSDPDRIMRQAELMRRQGKYPVSLSCRAGQPEGPFAPIVRIDWQENTANVEWELHVYKGQLEVPPSAGADWKKVVRLVLPTGSDRFYCLLYYKR